MRKTISVIAVLVALLLCCAGAARSEPALTSEIENSGDFAVCGLITDEEVVAVGLSNIYVWHVGDEKTTVYTGTDYPDGLTAAAFKHDGDFWTLSCSTYGVETPTATAYRMRLNDDNTYNIGEKVTIELPDGETAQGESINILSAVSSGDSLYIAVNIDNESKQLWRFEWDTGKTRVIRRDDIGLHLFPAPDGRILVECMDEDDGTAWYEMYDPQTDKFEQHGGIFEYDRMKGGMVGAAWDATQDCLYYQEDGQVKCAEDMEPNLAEQAASVIRPCDSETGTAGIVKGKYYAYMANKGPVVINLEESQNRTKVFKVNMPETYDAVIRALSAIEARHPDVMTVIDTQYYTDAQLSGQLAAQNDDVDIYIIPTNGMFAAMLYLQEYLDAITAPEVIEAISKMYPEVYGCLAPDGKLMAVPVSVGGYTLGINREVLEKLEGPDAELPTDAAEFVEKLEEINEKCGDHDEYSVFPLWLSADAIKAHLLQYVLVVYGRLYSIEIENDNNTDIGFDTPELKKALKKIMELDLEEMGIGEYSAGDILNIKTESLINSSAPTACVQYNPKNEAQPLSVLQGVPVLPINMTAAIINPNSANKELAQEFMAELTKHYDDTTKYTIFPEYNTPIADESIADDIKRNIEQRDALLGKAEQSEGIQKEEIENRLNDLNKTIEILEKIQWKLSRESIDRFRANADKMYVTTYNYAVSGDATELAVRLIKGNISVEEYVKELDRQTKMLIREGF